MEQEMTKAIMEVRKKVSREEWRERILECQSSGLPVQKLDYSQELGQVKS